jgi:hypothetical protein
MMWAWPDDFFDNRRPQGGGPAAADRESAAATDIRDTRLAYSVAQRLVSEPRVHGRRLTVEAQNGVAILSGVVDDEEARSAAGEAARSTAGVRDVCNMLVSATAVSPDGTGGIPAEFDRIVSVVTDSSRQAPSTGGESLGRVKAAVTVLGAAVWAVLSLALVGFGWFGVFVASVTMVAVLGAGHRRRSRRMRPARDARPGSVHRQERDGA